MLAPVAAWIAILGMEALASRCSWGGGPVLGGRLRHPLRLPGRGFRSRRSLHSIPARAASGQFAAGPGLSCCRCSCCSWFSAWRRRTWDGSILPAWWPWPGCWRMNTGSSGPDDLSRVNRAFFHVNGVISVGLLLVVLLQLFVNAHAS